MYLNNEAIMDYKVFEKIMNKTLKEATSFYGRYRPSTIWAIGRGGLVLAQYLAYRFDIEDIKIFDLYEARNVVKDFDGSILDNLICDDICDTGSTFLKISKALESQQKEAMFISLLKRVTSKFNGGLYGQIIYCEDYIKFPWDYSILNV